MRRITGGRANYRRAWSWSMASSTPSLKKESVMRRTAVPIETARSLDGIDLFKGMIAGRFPAPPISRMLGMTLGESSTAVSCSATRRC